jgi:hypothetical protein
LVLAAQMNKELGIPWEKAREVVQAGFGLEVSASTLCRAAHRLADKA